MRVLGNLALLGRSLVKLSCRINGAPSLDSGLCVPWPKIGADTLGLTFPGSGLLFGLVKVAVEKVFGACFRSVLGVLGFEPPRSGLDTGSSHPM